MADDDDDLFSTPQEDTSPLTRAIQQATTSSPEGKTYARRILDRGTPAIGNENDIINQIQSNADVAKQVLQQARQRLLSQSYDPTNSKAWFAASRALTAPSRTGSFAESIGNLSGAMEEEQARKQAFGQQQGAGDTELALKLAGIDDKVLQSKLGLAKLHEQGETGLEKEALNVLGREDTAKGATDPLLKERAQAAAMYPNDPAKQQAYINAVGQKAIRPPASEIQYTPNAGDYKLAAAIARYDAPYPGGMGGNTPRAMWLKDELADQSKYPSYSASNYPVVQAARTDFTKGIGSSSGVLTGLNTAMNHISTLRDVAQNLQQGRFPEVNKWLNSVGFHVGANMRPSADLVAQALGDEINRTLVQTGAGGEEERRALAKTMAVVNKNPAQMEDLINVTNKLLAGKVMPLYQKFQVTGWGDDDPRFGWKSRVSPNARLELWRVTHDPSETQPPQDLAYDYAKMHPEARESYKAHYGEPPKGFAEGGAVDPFAATAPEKPKGNKPAADPFDATPKQAEAPAGSVAGNVARALEQGATMRFGDELNAAVEPGDYGRNVQGEREDVSGFEHEHPIGSTALEVAGGAGSTVAALAALRALRGTGKLGAVERLLALASKYAPEGALIGKRAAAKNYIRPLVTGATLGSVAGAGSNVDPNNLGADMLEGAVTGAPLAVAGQQISRNVGSGLGALWDKLRGQSLTPGTRAIASSLGPGSAQTLNDMQTRLSGDVKAGVPSTIGDVAEGPTAALARQAMRKPGEAADEYTAELLARQEGAPGRVSDQINAGLVPDAYEAKQQGLTDALYKNAKPLYDKAYKMFPRVQSPALTELMETPAGQKATQLAFTKMQNEQVPIGTADATGMVQRPSLQYLDYVKRSLDDMISREEGTGPNWQANDEGRILRGMRGKLVDEIDQATTLPNGDSPYATARAQYKGDMEVRDALRSGLNDFDTMTPDQLEQHVGGMSNAEKEAFRSGVAESMFQKLRTMPQGGNPARKIIGQAGIKDKMGLLFDTPAASRKFITGLQRELEIYDSGRTLSAAGTAGQNIGARGELGDSDVGDILEAGARRGIGAAAMTGIRKLVPASKTPGQIVDIMKTPAADSKAKLDALRAATEQIKARNAFTGSSGSVGAGTFGSQAPDLTQQ